MEKLCLFTIADLKDWILKGKPKEGLSERIITPTRAYSFINNPYVTDDMPVVSALKGIWPFCFGILDGVLWR